MRDIRVATVQFQHAPGDKAYNLERVRQFVADGARAGVELIAFPEMCLTGYWHVRKLDRDAFGALSEPVPDGPSSVELLRLARVHGMSIGAGLVERDADGRFYNSYVVAMPDGRWAVHGEIIAESRALGDAMVVADLEASLLPTSSGRRWMRARRPELYGSLTEHTGREIETRRVRFGNHGPPA